MKGARVYKSLKGLSFFRDYLKMSKTVPNCTRKLIGDKSQTKRSTSCQLNFVALSIPIEEKKITQFASINAHTSCSTIIARERNETDRGL
jgi:hypothetical protein